jgi:hypothetical protein
MLVEGLDAAREIAGIPFIITCGYVTDVGPHVEHSAHLKGLAVDLRCWDSWTRAKMFPALWEVGFRRIGLYDRHIHVDIDPSLPKPRVWVGISK